MKTIFTLAIIVSVASHLNAAPEGLRLLEEKCSSCHMLNSSTKVKQTKISAPPMWGIMRNLQDSFATHEEGINFIIDYVMNPHIDKMVFPKAAEERFGLMPSMKGKLTDEELKTIANYLYR